MWYTWVYHSIYITIVIIHTFNGHFNGDDAAIEKPKRYICLVAKSQAQRSEDLGHCACPMFFDNMK